MSIFRPHKQANLIRVLADCQLRRSQICLFVAYDGLGAPLPPYDRQPLFPELRAAERSAQQHDCDTLPELEPIINIVLGNMPTGDLILKPTKILRLTALHALTPAPILGSG